MSRTSQIIEETFGVAYVAQTARFDMRGVTVVNGPIGADGKPKWKAYVSARTTVNAWHLIDADNWV